LNLLTQKISNSEESERLRSSYSDYQKNMLNITLGFRYDPEYPLCLSSFIKIIKKENQADINYLLDFS